jgi:Lectin C-type domain/PEP-CTERM motif
MKALFKAAIVASLFATGAASADPTVIDTATFNGRTYQLLSADSWTASEAFAVSLGAHLVAVNDAAENNFLISRFGSDRALWIGLSRTVPNAPTFAWANGDAVTFTNWAAGEPNNCCNGEDYTHTYTNGQWNDLDNLNGYAGPKYGVVELTTSPVPEPETYAMMLAGLGLLAVARRKQKAAKLAA